MPVFFKDEKKIIFLIFLISGVSGLLYEVVWLRMLSRVLGVTTYATAITLAAYMAGLGIGSYLFGKLADRAQNTLKLYAYIELLIAAAAILTPVLFNLSEGLYINFYDVSGGNTGAVMVLRSFISFFTLLIPTVLMGGTLPLLVARTTQISGKFGNSLSMLYSMNTFGAVIGVLLSGFITIGKLGEWQTIALGMVINLAVALAALRISASSGDTDPQEKVASAKKEVIAKEVSWTGRIVLASIFISGFTALAYEVIWTRQLILYLEVSIYAFSAMLAIFLIGIALGSLLASKLAVEKLNNPLVFGILQLLLAAVSLLNLYIFPLFDTNILTKMILSPVILVLPTALIFGIIFPVAAVSYLQGKENAGETVGTVYGFNTAGNVLGSLVTGFVLIGLMGSTKTVIMLALVNLSVGVILMLASIKLTKRTVISMTSVVFLILLLVPGTLKKDVFLDVIKNRILKKWKNVPHTIYLNKEGVQGTVTSYSAGGNKQLEVNGVGQTTLCTETKLMAHIPYLMADEAKKMLVICFGMGTIVRSAALYESLEIIAAELVPEIFNCFKYYHPNAQEVLNRKKPRLVAEDGRNFLLCSKETYDIISIDPSPPVHSAGTVNLYTKEFFELCKKHLTPGGVMCLWFPESGREEDNWMILRTFFEVFPETVVWRGPRNWGFYMTGKKKPIELNFAKLKNMFENKLIVDDLKEYDQLCDTPEKIMSLAIGDTASMWDTASKYPIITDNNPYTEFPIFRSKMNY